jgi:hypothetical protein
MKKSKLTQFLLASSILGFMPSLPAPREKREVTSADLERIEKARLKRERKAAKKGQP